MSTCLPAPKIILSTAPAKKILSLLFNDRSARNDGLTVLDCDNKIELSAIINAIDTAPLFGDKNVVLVKNAKFFKSKATDDKPADPKSADQKTVNPKTVNPKNANKKSGDKKSAPSDTTLDRLSDVVSSMLETNYVIFTTVDAPDKRKKLYKAIEKVGGVLEAEPLKSWQLEPWLNDKLRELKLSMDNDARQYFIETVALMPEVSLGLLDNELNKVALFVKGDRIGRSELQKVLASLPEISNFALSDAVLAKNLGKSMQLIRLQVDDVRNVMSMLALLARNVRLLLRAKYFMSRGLSGKALGEPLGLHPFIAQKTGDASKKFSAAALETALIDLSDADFGLKTGTAGAELIERAVMKLLIAR